MRMRVSKQKQLAEALSLQRHRHLRRFEPYLFILPAVVLLTFIYVYPLVYVIRQSFLSRHPLTGSVDWVGIRNYVTLFSDPNFLASVNQTLFWTVGSVVGQITFGIIFALILNERFPGNQFIRSILLMPWITSNVVIGLGWRWNLNEHSGVNNVVLRAIGLEPIGWLTTSEWAMVSLVAVNIWRGLPFATIMILAALSAIPKEQYDAASIDGADGIRSFIHVTLPNLRYVLGILSLLLTVWTITFFDLVFVMTQGGPARATTILPLLVYQRSFLDFNFGLGSAVAIILALVNLIFFVTYLRVLQKE